MEIKLETRKELIKTALEIAGHTKENIKMYEEEGMLEMVYLIVSA